MIGGWRDGYPNPPLRLYQALDVPKKVLIGPWNHAVPDVAVPGPRIDYLHEVVRWLDHWCKGTSTGVMDEPPVVVYMQHHEKPVVDRLEAAGEWRAELDWPPPGAGELTLHLGDERRARPTRRGAEGSRRLRVRAHRRRDRRPLVGRPPVRAAGRPAPRRGVLARLHLAAARRGRARHRPAPGVPARVLDRHGDRLRGEPVRRRARRHARTSSPRAC